MLELIIGSRTILQKRPEAVRATYSKLLTQGALAVTKQGATEGVDSWDQVRLCSSVKNRPSVERQVHATTEHSGLLPAPCL
jgi:hypothetical protein